MDKIIKFFALLLLTLINTASAEQILSISYTIYKNDTVSIESIKYIPNGTVKIYQPDSDEYRLGILGERKQIIATVRIPAVFYIFAEPPRDTNYSSGYQRLPWENDLFYINFYRNNTLMHTESLSKYICDSDAMCEPELKENSRLCPKDCFLGNGLCEPNRNESYLIDPQDCPSGSKDDFCDAVIDGVCDPDCKTSDADCVKTGVPYSVVAAAITGIVMLLGVWYYHRNSVSKRVNKIIKKLER